MQMLSGEAQRLHAMFTALADGDLPAFLGGCTSDVTLTARGVAEKTVIVRRPDIADWYGSMRELAGDTLCSAVLTVAADRERGVVVLRHGFARYGMFRQYDTVNFCTLRHDGLLAWFCHPVSGPDYARAWGLTPPPPGSDQRSVATSRR
jgi:hypothetical protein